MRSDDARTSLYSNRCFVLVFAHARCGARWILINYAFCVSPRVSYRFPDHRTVAFTKEIMRGSASVTQPFYTRRGSDDAAADDARARDRHKRSEADRRRVCLHKCTWSVMCNGEMYLCLFLPSLGRLFRVFRARRGAEISRPLHGPS